MNKNYFFLNGRAWRPGMQAYPDARDALQQDPKENKTKKRENTPQLQVLMENIEKVQEILLKSI